MGLKLTEIVTDGNTGQTKEALIFPSSTSVLILSNKKKFTLSNGQNLQLSNQ